MNAIINYITIPERKVISNEFLSKRNNRSAYEIPYEKSKVILVIEPEKVIISDGNIKQTIDYDFTYFIPEPVNYNPIELLEGTIFRGISNSPKELLQYYIIKDGSVNLIPNYKTVEVLLSERSKPIDSILVLEDKDLNEVLQSNNGQIDIKQLEENKFNPKSPEDLPSSSGGGGGGGAAPPPAPIESKEEEWKPDMTQEALAETFNSLLTTVTSAEDIAQSAVDTAKQTIDLAIANANKAEQESATAQTEAAAAIASAQQAEAEAQLLTSDQVGTLETVITDLDALETRVDTIEDKI